MGLSKPPMAIAVCSDEPYPVHRTIVDYLEGRGFEVLKFGSLVSGAEEAWAQVAEQAALAVAQQRAREGIFLCWSGTGICMAANKVYGVRAALCSDAGQVRAARVWNHANVLCLSNRTLADDMAKELLDVWFDTEPGAQGASGVERLMELDRQHRAPPK